MTFEEILNLDLIKLPFKQIDEDDFMEQLTDLLHEVEGYILESENLGQFESFNPKFFKSCYENLNKGILQTINEYYNGNPDLAYQKLEKTIKESGVKGFLPPPVEIPCKNFYRTRVMEGNYPVSRGKLFHIPFEKRRYINTQRYSIPGFPTLYLSSSLYVAWEEMRRPEFEKLKAVRIRNTKTIKCFDLTTERYSNDYVYSPDPSILSSKERDDMYAMMIWPLIAACSFKVYDDKAPFKPEYIIPQLMLQYVRKNNKIDGIKFSSTHIDLNNENIIGEMYNLAIPVKEDGLRGYCPELTKLFHSTDVLSMEVKKLITGTTYFMRQKEELDKVRQTTQSIELIKGRQSDYARTSFGSLELSLMELNEGPVV